MALLTSVAYSQIKVVKPKVVTPKVKLPKTKKVVKKKKKEPTPTNNYRKRPGGTIKAKKKDYILQFKPEEY